MQEQTPDPDAAIASATDASRAMAPIDKIKAAFRTKLYELPVPTFGFSIFFTPLTTGDLLVARQSSEVQQSTHEKNVALLLHKARTADGAPMFSPGDEYVLINEVRYPVLQKIIDFMFECGALSLVEAEDAVGNSPSSATT